MSAAPRKTSAARSPKVAHLDGWHWVDALFDKFDVDRSGLIEDGEWDRIAEVLKACPLPSPSVTDAAPASARTPTPQQPAPTPPQPTPPAGAADADAGGRDAGLSLVVATARSLGPPTPPQAPEGPTRRRTSMFSSRPTSGGWRPGES
jgi:hypothetical protein